VLDQDAEMVQPGVVHAAADLVGLEAQQREVDRAVAQVMAIGERPVIRAHQLEVERLHVEIRHRVGVLARNGEVAKLCHDLCPAYSAACLTGSGSASAPAQPCSAMSNRMCSGP